MLGLKLPTDPRWANIAEKNIEEILIDHAYCEQKAASTAISFIISYPELTELVDEMTDLAEEEMSHFKMVWQEMKKRSISLTRYGSDNYVVELMKFFPKGGSRDERLINRLLYAGLIEARSCERFKLLSEQLEDKQLGRFYHKLMISEANHYTLFLRLAHKYGEKESVDKKWAALLDYEAKIMQGFSGGLGVHG
jgi:tRNA-(ms[2]io[6]A)-hydroxylase